MFLEFTLGELLIIPDRVRKESGTYYQIRLME